MDMDVDDEQELLRQQEEFLAKSKTQKPAVKVVRIQDPSQQAGSASAPQAQPQAHTPQPRPSVMSNITEKASVQRDVVAPAGPDARMGWAASPLPRAMAAPAGAKRKSLFAQRFDSTTTTATAAQGASASDAAEAPAAPAKSALKSKASSIVQELSQVQESLHDKPVSSYTESELKEAHEEIKELLSPASIAFLQKKIQAKKATSASSAAVLPGAQPMAVDEPSGAKASLGQEHLSKGAAAMEQDKPVELPFKVEPLWVHMNVVESEKLRWVGSLSKDEAQHGELPSQDQQQVRFDFRGEVMAPETDLPTSLGLHHHGDQQSQAGYSLPELAHLARSTVPSQRAICLRMLACIVRKAWLGEYRVFHKSPLVRTGAPSTACAGKIEQHIVSDNDTILACILGLSVHRIMFAALLDTQITTIAIAVEALVALLCYPGDEEFADDLACLPNGLPLPALSTLDDTCRDGTGKQGDLVVELVAGGLVPRLVTILKRPELEGAHVDCLRILVRLARHSADCARAVVDTDGLLAWLDSAVSRGTKQLKFITTLAAKLIRVLCLAEKGIALKVFDADLLSRLYTFFLAEESGRSDVAIEGYRAWHACLTYGFAAQDWAHLHFSVLDRLTSLPSSGNLDSWRETASSINALTMLLQLSASPAAQSPAHSLHFHDAANLYLPVFSIAKSILAQPTWSDHAMAVLAAALNFVATFCKLAISVDRESALPLISLAVDQIITPYGAAITKHCLHALAQLPPLYSAQDGLPYRMTIHACWLQGCTHPLARFASAAMLSAFFDLVSACHPVHQGAVSVDWARTVQTIVDLFVQRAPRVAGDMVVLWSRWQVSAAAACLRIVASTPSGFNYDSFNTLLFYVIFNVEAGWEDLAAEVSQWVKIASPANPNSSSALQQLLTEEIATLTGAHIAEAAARRSGGSALTAMMLPCLVIPGRLPLSAATPLRPLYNATLLALQQATTGLHDDQQLTVAERIQLVNDLGFFALHCPSIVRFVSPGIVFATASQVFCLGYDVYKDDGAHKVLAQIVQTFTGDNILDVGDLASQRHFLRVFNFLVEEFSTMSFGDQLLARYILEYCRVNLPSDFRLRLLDNAEALRLCRIDYSSYSDAHALLYPLETDPNVVSKWLHAILERSVSPQTPALYWTAIHHIAGLLFGDFNNAGSSDAASEDLTVARKDLAISCLRLLGDAQYGDLLRYVPTPGTVPAFPLTSSMLSSRIATMCTLSADAPESFLARHAN